MNEEDKKLFDEYVASRRAKYSWVKFWAVITPGTFAVIVLVSLFSIAILGRS